MKKFFAELGYAVGDKVKCVQLVDEHQVYERDMVYELVPYENRNVEWPCVYINDSYLNGFGATWYKVNT